MRTEFTPSSFLLGAFLIAAPGAFAQVQSATSSGSTTTITNTTTAANVGQTITLSGVSYVVNAKKVLATGVEYYTVKATTPRAVTKYYLRTFNVYGATVFTQTQYETFLNTGKLSSFGTVKTAYYGGEKVVYVTKGSIDAFLFGTGNDLAIVELPTGSVLAQDGGGGEGTGSEVDLLCRRDCLVTRRRCERDAQSQSNPDIKAGMLKGCAEGFGRCWGNCYFQVPPIQSTHILRSKQAILTN